VRFIARDHRRGWSRWCRWGWLCWRVVARVEEEPTGIPHTGLRGAGSGQEAPDAQNCRYSGSRNHSFDVHRARILPRFDRALLRCRELTGLPVAGTPLCPCRQCLERTLEIGPRRRIGSSLCLLAHTVDSVRMLRALNARLRLRNTGRTITYFPMSGLKRPVAFGLQCRRYAHLAAQSKIK
jgi:hypothetical protein